MKINTVYKYKSIVLFVILSITIGACQSFEGRTKTIVGGLGGAAAGGLLAGAAGGGTEWIAAGSLLGALVGGAIGDRLDAADRRQADLAAARSLEASPSGTTTTWRNPDTGHAGSFTPIRTYQTVSSQYCREFQQTVIIGGKEQEAHGTACRQPDGSWEIIN